MEIVNLMDDYNAMIEEEDEFYMGIHVCEECTDHLLDLPL